MDSNKTIENLTKIKQLLDEGILTQEEFEAEKEKILFPEKVAAENKRKKEEARKKAVFSAAIIKAEEGTIEAYQQAFTIMKGLGDWNGADALANEYGQKLSELILAAEAQRAEQEREAANEAKLMQINKMFEKHTSKAYKAGLAELEKLADWRNVPEIMELRRTELKGIEAKEAKKRKKKKVTLIIILVLAVLAAAGVLFIIKFGVLDALLGYRGRTSGELRDSLMNDFRENYNNVTDYTENYFSKEYGELAFYVNGNAVLVKTQKNDEPYDLDSPIDYCTIIVENGETGIDCAATIVHELFNSFAKEDAKQAIKELLQTSKEKTMTDDSEIHCEGNVYNQGNLFCFYESDRSVIMIFPKSMTIEDVLAWSGLQ